MRKILPKNLKERAIKLRIEGRSYSEIKETLKIASKGTLSYWFKNLELPPEAKKRLENNINLAKKRGLFAFNEKRTKTVNLENIKIRSSAFKDIPHLSQEMLFLVGIALYWGEGAQSEKSKKSFYVSFVNSNPYMIALFFRFLREVLKIDDEKIRASIRIHPNIRQEETIKFWHKVTKLPYVRFRITRQISSASKFKRPKRSLPYGTLDIRINSRQLFFKIKGYIDGMSSQANLNLQTIN